jgi:hypothetical protein
MDTWKPVGLVNAMTETRDSIASALVGRFTKFASVLHELAVPLSEQQFWTKPFPFGNSFGHLVLHLTGNLEYYIGAQIAGTGYVRNRPLEFSNPGPPSKAEALHKFDDAIAMVIQTIRSQSAEDWTTTYAATGADAKDRFDMVLQCTTHLHHHIGQMIYMGFEWKRRG